MGPHQGSACTLLRELPCPVAVVPPDVDPSSFGDGPVLVGVEPDDASVAATALNDWPERHGFDDLSLETRVGRCRSERLAAASEQGACLIVCGS